MTEQLTRHHIISTRSDWTSNPSARRIRNTPSLIPAIPRDIHNTLHEECAHVPLIGTYALHNVLSCFEPTNDTMNDMEALMRAIDTSKRNLHTKRIEMGLADLAIQAIDAQRGYLRFALHKGQRYV